MSILVKKTVAREFCTKNSRAVSQGGALCTKNLIRRLFSALLSTLAMLCLCELLKQDCLAANHNKMFDFSAWNQSCQPTLVVINKDNPIPNNYMIALSSYQGKQINSALKNDLNDMVTAASRAGVRIFICSGYRSIGHQTRLFNAEVLRRRRQGHSEKEAQLRAAMVVARPKTSEHNTGLAIDFNCVRDDFYKTKEFAWLINNAHKYGFILRYAKDKVDKTCVVYEPWHFRYVGKEHSSKIIESGLCLEEYIQQHLIK